MAEGDAPTGAETTAADSGDAGRTFTQADLDHIVGERLSKERGKYADYDDLKSKAARLAEIEAANKSDLENLLGERDTFKTQAEQTAAENLRLRIAMEKKLPAALIDRLQGGTKEEMEADADKLLELVSPTPDFDGGTRERAPVGDMNAFIRAGSKRA